jgi:phospholipase C
MQGEISRRTLLKGLGAVGAGAAVVGMGGLSGAAQARQVASVGPTLLRRIDRAHGPGSRPYPKLPEGVDTLPLIENIIVVMMENHSYDDHFGMLRRGDGFQLRNGQPRSTNPDGKGNLIRSFRMPSTCQLNGAPGQNWNASHTAWDRGRNEGFVEASGPVAMGYWNQEDLPFYYGLANTFPLSDRWFCSTLAQTYPNRRFFMAGTASGVVATNTDTLTISPAHGTIFDRFHFFGIPWRNYYTNLPSAAIILQTLTDYPSNFSPIAQFYTDAAAGTLPPFSLVDPNFDTESEEDNQDIRVGEQFASKVINAVMHGPQWNKTLLIWTYDEHGGYYDHVPPPRAVPPDNIPPDIEPTDFQAGYTRYGFRVPAVIVSPYARRNYVSHVVHDHTSILKLIETKWNFEAMTFRDARADNLLDSIDLRRPAFLEPPTLPAPALASGPDSCTPGNPGGPIPPPSAVIPA